ncbi:MAG: hypothetical protein LBF16_05885 [Pseudomonadales bacterium]|jgi:hypothetical protein|nr:hypothetical protein [Pseudomonadales bacterium]
MDIALIQFIAVCLLGSRSAYFQIQRINALSITDKTQVQAHKQDTLLEFLRIMLAFSSLAALIHLTAYFSLPLLQTFIANQVLWLLNQKKRLGRQALPQGARWTALYFFMEALLFWLLALIFGYVLWPPSSQGLHPVF